MNKNTMRIAGWALGLSLAVAGIGVAVGASQGAAMETRATNGADVGDEITSYDKIRDGYSYKIVYTISSTDYYLTTSISSNKGSVDSTEANAGVFLFESTGTANEWYISFDNSGTKTYIRPNSSNATVTTSTSSTNMGVTGETISNKIGLYRTISDNKWYMAANSQYKTCGGYKSTSNQQYIAKMIVVSTGVVNVTSLNVEESSVDLYLNTTKSNKTLTATISPNDATDKVVNWSSGAESVATVNTSGVVTAAGKGAATITAASHEDANIKDTCDVTVWEAKSITVTNPENSGVKTNYMAGDDPDHTGLVATITWDNGTTTKTEDVTALATWTDTGAPGAGDESIFFNAAYAGVNADFELAVTVAAEPIYPATVSVSYSDTTLYVGEDEAVASVGYTGEGVNQLAFGFSSSDPTVLSVDSDGTVHALKAGEATISYFSDYDGKRDTIKATVDFVVENVPPTGITLSSSSGSISEDAAGTLDFTVTVEGNPTIPGFTAVATDTTIVDVEIDGNTVKLDPKKAGSTTITVSTIATPIQSNVYTVTVTAIPKYTLVKDITNLTIGNKVIFVDEDSAKAMKLYASGNNIKTQDVAEETTDVIKKADTFAAYTIGADQYGYTFKGEDDNYLYAASTSANHLKSRAALNNDLWDRWEVSIDSETGIAAVTSIGNTSRGVMQYNSSNDLFACYASASQSDIKMYVLNTSPSVSDKVETFSQLFMHKGDVSTDDEGTSKCVSENWFSDARTALSKEWASIAADFAASGAMWDRYVEWGAHQTPKVVVTYSGGIQYNAIVVNGFSAASANDATAPIIVTILATGAVAATGYFFLRKKKEN